MSVTYLDSSAIVKLAVAERESSALRRHLRRSTASVSSAIARTEVFRALLGMDTAAQHRASEVLEGIDLVRVNDRVLNAAGRLLPADLRSLDAIHLATAALLGDEIREVVTYDRRMAAGAGLLGLRVTAPA